MATGNTSFNKGHDHGFTIKMNGKGHTTLAASTLEGTSHDHPIVNGEVLPAVGADGTLHVYDIPVKLTEFGYEST